MCVQAFYSLQACIITVLVGLTAARYLQLQQSLQDSQQLATYSYSTRFFVFISLVPPQQQVSKAHPTRKKNSSFLSLTFFSTPKNLHPTRKTRVLKFQKSHNVLASARMLGSCGRKACVSWIFWTQYIASTGSTLSALRTRRVSLSRHENGMSTVA